MSLLSLINARVPARLLDTDVDNLEDMETLLDAVIDIYSHLTELTGEYIIDLSDSSNVLNSTFIKKANNANIVLNKHSSQIGTNLLGKGVATVEESGEYVALAQGGNSAIGLVAQDSDERVVVVTSGLVSNSNWSLDSGRKYWLDATGDLTANSLDSLSVLAVASNTIIIL